MSQSETTDDLFSRTWKTVVLLVGACVLFVGALSTTAVLVANRAVAPAQKSSDTADAPEGANAATKTPAKKPVSI